MCLRSQGLLEDDLIVDESDDNEASDEDVDIQKNQDYGATEQGDILVDSQFNQTDSRQLDIYIIYNF